MGTKHRRLLTTRAVYGKFYTATADADMNCSRDVRNGETFASEAAQFYHLDWNNTRRFQGWNQHLRGVLYGPGELFLRILNSRVERFPRVINLPNRQKRFRNIDQLGKSNTRAEELGQVTRIEDEPGLFPVDRP